MAKINVYLPDDLHREWLANRSKANLSPICQRALREVLSGQRENPPSARRLVPRDDPLARIEAQLGKILERLDTFGEGR